MINIMEDQATVPARLDAAWKDFENYVENDENHENPDPRDIPWPNDMFWKVQCLSQAWRVLWGIPGWENVKNLCDLAMPLANMITIGQIQFPDSKQRYGLEWGYYWLVETMDVNQGARYYDFHEMIEESRKTHPTTESDDKYWDWMLARCAAYNIFPGKIIEADQVVFGG